MPLSETLEKLTCTHTSPHISRLRLHEFRNYAALELLTEAHAIVLVGSNGAGKTNLLEALSFLAPGRGLRGAKLADVDRQGGAEGWAVVADVDSQQQRTTIGTGRGLERAETRRVLINGAPVRGQQPLAETLSILWVTPSMDGLWMGAASERRQFWDRIVSNFIPHHTTALSHYEKSLRERARVLALPSVDDYWLDALEQKLAESAVTIAAARNEVLERIVPHLTEADAFPLPALALEGLAEKALLSQPALAVEERLKELWRSSRGLDRHMGRTRTGVHRSDLMVHYHAKNQPASACSTGEQKALMLSLLLAVVRARHTQTGACPVVLLDEVIAHLDAHRRAALFAQLLDLGAQTWMTGTDESVFAPLEGEAQLFRVRQDAIDE